MSSDANLLEHLLDRIEKIPEEHVQMPDQVLAIVTRLEKVNGPTGNHEQKLSELKVWSAIKEAACQAHHCELGELGKSLKAHEEQTQVTNQTVLKIAVLAAITVMTVFQVGGPLVEKLAGLVK
jgi:hypothetical protein